MTTVGRRVQECLFLQPHTCYCRRMQRVWLVMQACEWRVSGRAGWGGVGERTGGCVGGEVM